jgi:hypothetical protein
MKTLILKIMLFLSLLILNQDVVVAQVYDYSPSGFVYGFNYPDNIEVKFTSFSSASGRTKFRVKKHDNSAWGQSATVKIRIGSTSGRVVSTINFLSGDYERSSSEYYYFESDLSSGNKVYFATMDVNYLHRAGPLNITARLESPLITSPASGSTVSGNFNISWLPVAQATTYRVVISTSSSFTQDPSGNSPFPDYVYNEATTNTSISVNLPPGNFYISARGGSTVYYHSVFCQPVSVRIAEAGQPNIMINPTSMVITQQAMPESPKSRLKGGGIDRWNPTPSSSATLSEEHFGKGAIIPDSVKSYWRDKSPRVVENADNLATIIDWSYRDSEVKNQGSCGSCWSFASIALAENLGFQTDLSEQELVSCVSGSSCAGGNYADALNYLTWGVVGESCFPYLNSNGDCSMKCGNASFYEKLSGVSNFLWGQATVDLLRSYLTQGPLVVYMLVPLGWNYSGGVYDYTGPEIPEYNAHAILVVGYSDGQQAFLFKNSWGASWGEGGYGRISYQSVSSNMQFGWYASTASASSTIYSNSNSEFLIQNTGNAELLINSISSNRPWLNTSISSISVGAGQEVSIPVTVNWSYLGQFAESGSLTINSNDPDQNIALVEVTAIPSSISDIAEDKAIPEKYALEQNYPNPFNPETVIRYSLPVSAYTKGVVYDVLGKVVATLVDGEIAAGNHELKFNALTLPSGVYIFRLEAGKYSSTIKMVLSK